MHTDRNSLGAYLAGLDRADAGALIIAAVILAVTLYFALHYLTRTSRARARAAAAEWASAKRVEWDARASVRAAARTERASAGARARRSKARARAIRFGLVALVAIAATRLSAYAVQHNLDQVAGAWDIRAAVFVCFEGALALCAGLSYWHQTSGRAGFDQFNVAVWVLSGLMSVLAWHGAGALGWFFAPFPLMAAIAWHWLVTFEAREAGHARTTVAARVAAAASAWFDRVRVRLGGTATAEDTNDRDRQRRLSRIARCAVKANTARAFRGAWARAYARALNAADERGILDADTRASLRSRVAARYAGAAALSPEAVADANPWTTAAAPAVDPTPSAPAAPASAPVVRSVPVPAPTTPAPTGDPAACMAMHFTGTTEAYEWVLAYFHDHGKWPTGKALGAAIGVHEATGRTLIRPVRDAWATS